MTRQRIHQQIYLLLVIVCICVLPFSKWVSSVSVILLAINWLVEGGFKTKFSVLSRNIPALLMIGFFFCDACGLFYTSGTAVCQFSIQKKLPFLALGVVLGSITIFKESYVRSLFYCYTISLLAASIYCFSGALYRFGHDRSVDHFFYHALGEPLHFHAVYFSVWIFIALFFIVTEILSATLRAAQKYMMLAAFCWLSIFLILLSSKLVIVIFFISLLTVLGINLRKSLAIKPLIVLGACILIVITVVLYTSNNVSKRFDDIRNQGISIKDYKQDALIKSTDFNGLSLRLLLWQFGVDILRERHAWIAGVSSGDSQKLLNEKIVNAHMYTGETTGKDHGYLNYNFHNQFVETIVQSGAIGLLFLSLLLAALFFQAIKSRNVVFCLLPIIFLSFFCTESVLENQKGIIPFVLLSLFFSGLYGAGKGENSTT